MKRFAIVALIVLTILALPIVYSTVHGYTHWWFWRNATVTVNGTSAGYLHRRLNNEAVLITRTDTSPRQSYLVALSGRGELIHCDGWSAPRFFVFPIGHVNPPCSIFSNGADDLNADNGVFSTLLLKPNGLEFTTISGKHVAARW